MPRIEINESTVDVAHETTVGRIGGDVFYLRSRGLGDDEAKQLVVSGVIEPIRPNCPSRTPWNSTDSSNWRWRVVSADSNSTGSRRRDH